MNVRLITTWAAPCGIAEHSWYLVDSVQRADSEITFDIIQDLHPSAVLDRAVLPQILTLNYHMGLHSQWGPKHVQAVRARGTKVVLIFHDTIGEHSPAELRERGDTRLDRLEQLAGIVDALIVHEPCAGFPDVHYWRMGVPEAQPAIWPYTQGSRPVLGSIGLPFPWKNFDLLARVTREIGWGLVLIAPGATETQVNEWKGLNPHCMVRTDFVSREEAVSRLTGCDATAFPYTCANTAQSAAILQGIAARKPVIATAGCRQFRALFEDPLGRTAITWIESLEDLAFTLSHLIRIERTCPAIVALAEQDSWVKLGAKYAQLYRRLA